MTMPKQMLLILAAATLSTVSAVSAAQAAQQPGQTSSNSIQQETAPIEHAYPDQNTNHSGPMPQAAGQTVSPGTDSVTTTEPIAGVSLRVAPHGSVQQVSNPPAEGSAAQKFE